MAPVLLSRRFVALGMVVVALVATFVEAGFWQLRRLDERRRFNAHFVERERAPAQPLAGLFPTLPATSTQRDASAYRRAIATGRFDTDHEVILLSRSFDGISGHHVLTPLVTKDGALLVDRGWVPEDLHDPPVAQAAPPAASVTVSGVLFPSQRRGLLGPKDPPTGVARSLFRVDVPRLQRQLPYPLYPLYLQLLRQEPPQSGELPKLVTELPTLDEGPHRSYAIQWFAFALSALATYLALVRRAIVRERAGTKRDEASTTR